MKRNTVADALSRIGEEINTICFKNLITETDLLGQQDKEMTNLKDYKQSNLKKMVFGTIILIQKEKGY